MLIHRAPSRVHRLAHLGAASGRLARLATAIEGERKPQIVALLDPRHPLRASMRLPRSG